MLDTSKVYTSKNYGDFEIIEYFNARKIKIKFVNTGYMQLAEAGDIRRGDVKDRLSLSVLGVGYFGVGRHKSGSSVKTSKPYHVWHGMLQRCYCPNFAKKMPSYKGCIVDDDWHNFQAFAEWFCDTYPKDGKDYDLDKDILSGSVLGKIYSKYTCKWVSAQENIEHSQAGTFKFTSPDGKSVDVFNLSKFCRENSLSQGSMSNVHLMKINQHKGWTKPR